MLRDRFGRVQNGSGGPALQRRGRNCWLPVMLFVGYLGYYYLAHQEEVPLTGRKQLVDLNREQETALGYQSYRQILSQSQVVPSGQAVDLVRDIGRRLAAVAEDPGFKREFSVIASDQVNAFCLPGGKVAVYTGILPVAKNADGLASMMGHEIAHAIARHGTHCSSEARTDREFRCQHGTG